MKHQDKFLDQEDLDYFVLLCKSFALHDCFFPIIYDIYCGGGESLSYTDTEKCMDIYSQLSILNCISNVNGTVCMKRRQR